MEIKQETVGLLLALFITSFNAAVQGAGAGIMA